MGSMIATEWARLYPEEIAGVVLINTSDRGNSWFFERLRPEAWKHIIDIVTHPKDSIFRENKIIAMTAAGYPQAEEWVKKFSKLPTTSMENFARQLIASSRYQFPKERPKVPFLILASRRDQMVNSVCTERIARRWNLTAEFHPRAGHDLPLWAPDWIFEKIEIWQNQIVESKN